MTDLRKAAQQALEKIAMAHAKIDALCLGNERWTMSVPARPDHDHDLVISGALYAAAEVLRAALAQQDEPVEPVSNEAMRLAGLALIGLAEHDQHCDVFDLDDQGRHKVCTCGLNDAIAVITQAGKSAPPQQAEPVQEPVAWLVYTEDGRSAYVTDSPNDLVGAYRALARYTTPPQRKPLSDADLAKIWDDALDQLDPRDQLRFIARAIERAHGIGGNDE